MSKRDLYEIIVWPKESSTGDRFTNKSKELVDDITDSIANVRPFKLFFSDGSLMVYAAGSVSRIHISKIAER